MERLADVDTVVFDKTGTLTLGRPRLVNAASIDAETLAIAAAIARYSRHPLSLAIVQACPATASPSLDNIVEQPGLGIEATVGNSIWRLGRAEWALDGELAPADQGTVLTQDGMKRAAFDFEDVLRPDARAVIAELKETGLNIEMLSGDRVPIAEKVAAALHIDNFAAGLLPAGKVERLATLAAQDHKAVMVGDGLNDAPALAAAHVSIAPATAADIGRNAADFVFLRESLSAIPLAAAVSRQAGRLIRQNLALAILYNAIAVPIAILGFVTPLVAAIAMSGSSLLVIGNALRLGIGRKRPQQTVTSGISRHPASLAIAQ